MCSSQTCRKRGRPGPVGARAAGLLLALALLCGLLSACSIESAAGKPLLQRFVWFDVVDGQDIRAQCRAGGLWRYRLVYNGRYQEQLRRYEVIADGAGGAILVAQAQGSGNLAAFDLGDLLAPWRWQRSETRLTPEQVAAFEAALDESGFFGPPPVGLRLPSAGFYWTAVACREGRVHFNAWRYDRDPERFAGLAFPAFLFALDGTEVPPNPPRDIDTAHLTFSRPIRNFHDNQGTVFWLTVGDNGLKGF